MLLLLLLLPILRRWRGLLAIRVLRRWAASPLIGARQAILLRVLRVLLMGHVRTGLMGRREGRVHMSRRWVCAVGRL